MTSQSALAIVQRFCKARGLTQPTVLTSSTDPGFNQMQALLEEEVNELVTRYEWQQTQYFFSFALLASQQQGFVDGNIPGSTTAGYQTVNVHGAKTGSSSTGLANSATVYTATVAVNGTNNSITVTGSAAQTYTNLITQINADLTGATAALTNGNIVITSAATGIDSTISITDGTTNLLFGTLTDYAFIDTAVPGMNPIIPASAGFWKILNDVLWNTNRHLPLFGPRSPKYIATLIAIPNTGPFLQYNIWNNQLNILPNPTAGDKIIGFYQSKFGWVDTTGVTTGQYINADTDVCLLDETAIYLGLKWRWLKAKGLSYADEQAKYELFVGDLIVANRPRMRKSLGGGGQGYFDPVVIMSAGNWAVQT